MSGKQTQGFLDFSTPEEISIANIDTRGWRRISVASGRCIGNCSACTYVFDLRMLAGDASMGVISFGPSGNPLLSGKQINILRLKRERSIPNESTDSVDIRVETPPAPLQQACGDDEI